MPIQYSTCLARDVLYVRCVGRVAFDDTMKAFERYRNDPNYRAGRPELIDLSAQSETEFDYPLTRTVVREIDAHLLDRLPRAHKVIFAPNEAFYGLARMFQTLSELANSSRVEVFRCEKEALAALALPYCSLDEFLSAERFEAAAELAGLP